MSAMLWWAVPAIVVALLLAVAFLACHVADRRDAPSGD